MKNREDTPLLNIDYSQIEARILAHMASEKKVPTGKIVHDFGENGHHFQVELLETPNLSGAGYSRPFRLWHNGSPALGGQWHYTIEGAIRRAKYVIEGTYVGKIARLEIQLAELERKVAAHEHVRTGSGGAMSAGVSEKPTPSRMATARIDIQYSDRVSHGGAIEIHAPTLEQAEAKRDVLIEQRDAICDFLQAWDALPYSLTGRGYRVEVLEKWLNGDDMKAAVADLRKISRFESAGNRTTLRQTVRTALSHLEHMAAHVGRVNAWFTERHGKTMPGVYSLEGLAEDVDAMRAAVVGLSQTLGKVPGGVPPNA